MDPDSALLATAEWLWSTPITTLPDIEHRTRLLLLDTLGCAIAGTAETEIQALARELGQDGALRLPGLNHGLSPDAFAFCFAAGACWHEACEGLAAAHGRPGLHAIPAALALSPGATLGEVLDAVAAGFEIGGRVGIAYRIRPGMHVDGTWGSFAAVAASCRIAGMTPAATVAALNHAACHLPFSLYRPIAKGSTARNMYVGHGAVFGMAAAAATRAGLGGPPGSIAEATTLALGKDLPAITPPPGRWLLPEGYLKFYAAVKHVHYGALAAARWHAERRDPATIDRIVLTIYEEAQTYCGNRHPNSPIQAQFSLSYGLAWTLLHGDLTPTAYAHLDDPAVQRLEELVEIRTRPDTVRSCDLAIGTDWTTHVDSVPGDPGRPMDSDIVTAKFRTYAIPVIGADHTERLLARLLHGGAHEAFTLD
ncbi:MmgE/PrpD family protein [Acidisphaera sp. L21]|uniref:MmgE/PrpD family protein n=1 Tax=Acidisphaera sp. L21 TaxID=1641851 RepID=UPI00131B9245|nr:MmgE/PrpD family protein [Acidisphaera sp. L21]